MNNVICTTVSDDDLLEIFSRAKHLVLINDNGEVIHREVNPAINSLSKRPTVAKRCVELGADIVLAPHGSLCYPSYTIFKRSGVKIYVTEPGIALQKGLGNARRVTQGEVIYSSILAVIERISEVFKHD